MWKILEEHLITCGLTQLTHTKTLSHMHTIHIGRCLNTSGVSEKGLWKIPLDIGAGFFFVGNRYTHTHALNHYIFATHLESYKLCLSARRGGLGWVCLCVVFRKRKNVQNWRRTLSPLWLTSKQCLIQLESDRRLLYAKMCAKTGDNATSTTGTTTATTTTKTHTYTRTHTHTRC